MWRNSYSQPHLAGIDGRMAVLIVLFLFHIRIWTAELIFGIVVILAVIEFWFGVTVEVAYRKFRSTLAGRTRPATLRDHLRRAIDYGYIEFRSAKSRNEEWHDVP